MRLTAPPLGEVSRLDDCHTTSAGKGPIIDLTLSLEAAVELAELLSSATSAWDDTGGGEPERDQEPA